MWPRNDKLGRATRKSEAIESCNAQEGRAPCSITAKGTPARQTVAAVPHTSCERSLFLAPCTRAHPSPSRCFLAAPSFYLMQCTAVVLYHHRPTLHAGRRDSVDSVSLAPVDPIAYHTSSLPASRLPHK
jgi:hypothetical protein